MCKLYEFINKVYETWRLVALCLGGVSNFWRPLSCVCTRTHAWNILSLSLSLSLPLFLVLFSFILSGVYIIHIRIIVV